MSLFCGLAPIQDRCSACGRRARYGSEFHKCHIAFNVSLAELLDVGKRLNTIGIKTQNFAGKETIEPSVIGWMPSAQLYFSDRDGHSVEFIALLDESAEPEFVGTLSEWRQRSQST